MLVMLSTYEQTKLSSEFRSGEEVGSERTVQTIWSNYLILAVVLRDSSADKLLRLTVDPSLGLPLFLSTMLLSMPSDVYMKFFYSFLCLY